MQITKIWVVTQPRQYSTLVDICFSCTPIELERQFKGGLRVDVDGVEFYTNKAEATRRALNLLSITKDKVPS